MDCATQCDPPPFSGLGRLVVIRGCMFAGKTARLIALLAAEQATGRRVRAFKHVLDARYDAQHLVTHDGRSFPAAGVESAAALNAAIDCGAAADGIGVDEAQFFGAALVGVCRTLVAAGRLVIVAGIHHDAWGQDFPPLPELARMADAVETLCAPCGACGGPAEYTQRVVPVVGGNLVGGPREFSPRCAACFRPLPPPAPVYG